MFLVPRVLQILCREQMANIRFWQCIIYRGICGSALGQEAHACPHAAGGVSAEPCAERADKAALYERKSPQTDPTRSAANLDMFNKQLEERPDK